VDILIGYELETSSWGYLVQRAAHHSINLTAQLSRVNTGIYRHTPVYTNAHLGSTS